MTDDELRELELIGREVLFAVRGYLEHEEPEAARIGAVFVNNLANKGRRIEKKDLA